MCVCVRACVRVCVCSLSPKRGFKLRWETRIMNNVCLIQFS